jgi:hypothetical protein
MSGDEVQDRESHEDDLAYVRKDDPDRLGLDYVSVNWSINRLSTISWILPSDAVRASHRSRAE